MGQFRKKPLAIEAFQLPAEDDDDTVSFQVWAASVRFDDYTSERDGHLSIQTLEGKMLAAPGDWIIKGIKGEFYPCKPDIFAASYEAVVEPTWCSQCPHAMAFHLPDGNCPCGINCADRKQGAPSVG